MWLSVDGPERIVKYLAEKEPTLESEIRLTNAHPCQTCTDIYQNPKLREASQKYYKEKVGEVLLKESFEKEKLKKVVEVRRKDLSINRVIHNLETKIEAKKAELEGTIQQ